MLTIYIKKKIKQGWEGGKNIKLKVNWLNNFSNVYYNPLKGKCKLVMNPLFDLYTLSFGVARKKRRTTNKFLFFLVLSFGGFAVFCSSMGKVKSK